MRRFLGIVSVSLFLIFALNGLWQEKDGVKERLFVDSSVDDGQVLSPNLENDSGKDSSRVEGDAARSDTNPTDDDEGSRELLQGTQVSITDSVGNAIKEGTLFAIQINEELQQMLEKDLAADFWKIQGVAQILEFDIVGELPPPLGLFQIQKALVWVESNGYFADPRILDRREFLNGESLVVELRKAKPLRVQVVDSHGNAMRNLGVYCHATGKDKELLLYDWKGRLQRAFYLGYQKTNSEGRAAFHSPVDWSMSLGTEVIDGYSQGIRGDVYSGEEVEIVMYPGTLIRGKVQDIDGKPIAGAYVAFMARDNTNDLANQGHTTTDEDGEYVIEDVATKSDALIGLVLMKGFTTQFKPIHHLNSEQEYEVDFVIQKGDPVEFSVTMSDGTIVDGIEFLFGNVEFDWIPGRYTTDKNGTFTTSTYLQGGRPYLAYWHSGGAKFFPIAIETPAQAPFRESIVLPDLGRYRDSTGVTISSDGNIEIDQLQFEFHILGKSKLIQWSIEEPSPWLPAQPGRLRAFAAEGWSTSISHVVKKGDHERLEAEFPTSLVQFELPWRRDNEKWKVKVDAAALSKPKLLRLDGGEHKLRVGLGNLSIQLEEPGNPPVLLGPFRIEGNGLNLGLLQAPIYKNISGEVITSTGKPWKNVRLWLMNASGWNAKCLTDKNGYYLFQGVVPGVYRVEVSPFNSHFVPVPNISASVEVLAHQSDQAINFVVDPDHLIKGRLSPFSSRYREASLIAEDRLQRNLLSADGEFTFQGPDTWCLLLAYGRNENVLHIVGREVPKGSRNWNLESGRGVKRKTIFKDSSGELVRSAEVRVYSEGNYILTHHTDSNGVFAGKFTPGLGLELQVRSDAHFSDRIPLDSLPSQGEYILEGSDSLQTWSVTGITGTPISLTHIRIPSLSLDAMTDSAGEAKVPTVASAYSATFEKADYWTVVTDSNSQRITLRRKLDYVELPPIQGIQPATLEIEPLFDLGYSTDFTLLEEDGLWTLKNAAEGRYRLRGFDPQGALIFQGSVYLEDGREPVFE